MDRNLVEDMGQRRVPTHDESMMAAHMLARIILRCGLEVSRTAGVGHGLLETLLIIPETWEITLVVLV
eukprot:1805542-Pyramimonas_sp.AAC.2